MSPKAKTGPPAPVVQDREEITNPFIAQALRLVPEATRQAFGTGAVHVVELGEKARGTSDANAAIRDESAAAERRDEDLAYEEARFRRAGLPVPEELARERVQVRKALLDLSARASRKGGPVSSAKSRHWTRRALSGGRCCPLPW